MKHKDQHHVHEKPKGLLSRTYPVVGIAESYYTKISGTKAEDSRNVAGILSSLSGSAQEEVWLLTADRSGELLNLHCYSKGSCLETTAIINEMAGHLLALPKAHTTYLVHNHPSGDLIPSPADHHVIKTLKATLAIKQIQTKGLLIANKQFVEFDEAKVFEPGVVPAGKPETLFPVSERKIIARKPQKQDKVLPGNTAINRLKRSPDGILFTDHRARELEFVPFEKGPTRDVAARILAKADELNATEAFINLQTHEKTNRGYLYLSLAKSFESLGINLRDIIAKNTNGELVSLAQQKVLTRSEPSALCKLNSDEVLYATSSDFHKPEYYTDFTPGQGLGLADIQKRFKDQSIFKGDDGSLSIHFKNGQGAKITFIEHISPEEKRMLIQSGRMDEGGTFLGKSSSNEIFLDNDLASSWILDHELCHVLKNLGLMTPKEFHALDEQIQSWLATGPLNFKLKNPEDDRAHALAQILADREAQRSTKIGATVQKVTDFIDGLKHIGRASATKLAREIESGKIFERINIRMENDRISPAAAAIQRDINQHQEACLAQDKEIQRYFEQQLQHTEDTQFDPAFIILADPQDAESSSPSP